MMPVHPSGSPHSARSPSAAHEQRPHAGHGADLPRLHAPPALPALDAAGAADALHEPSSFMLQPRRRVGGPTASALPAPPGRPAAAVEHNSESPARADLQQAAYLLARQVTGRPLSPTTQDMLWQGHETRKQVHELLPHGRANVVDDLRQTGFARVKDFDAGRELLTERVATEPGFASRRHLEAAALATHTGIGNCYEMTTLAAHLHAAKLPAGQTLLGQRTPAVDHTWLRAQCNTPEHLPSGWGRAAIIDPWMEGPVVVPGDTDLQLGRQGPIMNFLRIDGSHAPATAQVFEEARATVAARSEPLLSELRLEQTTGPMVLEGPRPLVSAVFAEQARARIDAASPDRLLEQATQALMSAPGQPTLAQAQAHAHEVVAFARDLQQPLDRPLAPPPDDSPFMFRPIAPNDRLPRDDDDAPLSPR